MSKRKKIDHISREHNLVVPNEIGTTVNPRNLLRNMKILIKKAEVPNITFHDLRHIHASLLLQQNIHMKVVSERLGHT
ncbi:tyrosine-type recombinase/integrase [Peribacillus butanolivorans]|uniref:tyrosine-type recombinase/integrase n=1 Tax=Peribacillus butanolivorans TaxID=421767 RepID=UPI00366BAA4E